MYPLKIAIIDDEIHAIHHLERLIYSSFTNIQIVTSYTNAAQALDELPALSPDLVFVDIMMPVINGLEFSAQYLKKDCYVKIIILTSYRDFEFAKKSVEIGVYDYWLKNELRPNTITKKLEQVTHAVEQARLLQESVEIQKISQILKKELPFSTVFPTTQREARYFLIIIPKLTDTAVFDNIKKTLSVLISEQNIHFSRFVPSLMLHYCIAEFSSDTLIGLERIWKSFQQTLLQNLTESNGICLLITNYFREQDFSAEHFQIFLNIVYNFYPDPSDRLHFINEHDIGLYRNDSELYKYLDTTYFNKLISKIDSCEFENSLSIIRKIWEDSYIKARNRTAIQYCLKRICDLGASMNMTQDVSAALFLLLEQYPKFSLKMLQSETLAACSRLFLPWGETVQSSSQKIVTITRYIKKNYFKDLKLSLLADEFELSADYLRKLFKSETGTSITDYITNVRMTAAQDLLKTGKYKIYEIADIVGYNSATYFSQAFFKWFGYYPTENSKKAE